MGIDHETNRISYRSKRRRLRKGWRRKDRRSVLEKGQVLKGIIEDSKSYGLFVRLPQLGPKLRGLLPVEEVRDSEKGDVKKKFPRGKEIQVEIISIDEKGKIRLSQRVMEERRIGRTTKSFRRRRSRVEAGNVRRCFQELEAEGK